MITGRAYREGRPSAEAVDARSAREMLTDPSVFLWLDAQDPTEQDLAALKAAFSLHPLTLEDVRHRHQRPKVEIFQEYAFVALRPAEASDDGLTEGELHAFVGPRFLATLRYSPSFDMRGVIRRWESQPELLAEGGGFAVYALIDEVVDDYLTAVERFEDQTDDLEDRVFETDTADEGQEVQQRLFVLKREVVRLRRVCMPLRQGLDLIQERPALATAPLGPYYRDVTDHVIRVMELADNIRDLLTSLLEVRVAQVANHLNEIMKKLTSWAAIILIPTLIAGIYGMNFRRIPELDWSLGYPVAIATMAAASTILYAVFKKNEWL